jgi:hypothetical protein
MAAFSWEALAQAKHFKIIISFKNLLGVTMNRSKEILHLTARFRRGSLRLAGILIISALFGCAHTETIMIPPKVDLTAYKLIGVITFSSDAREDLTHYATESFMGAAASAQPGVRLLELGPQDRLLKSMGRSELDFETIRSLGKAYQVDAVIAGHLQMSDPKPDVHVRSFPAGLSASAYVDAILSSKLYETDTGATVWSQSSSGSQSVGHVGLRGDGAFRVGFSDPDAGLRNMIQGLVFQNTQDFRPEYVRQ